MSKRIVQTEINCGENTCASESGDFCKFLGSNRFGTVFVCMLFPNPKPGRKDSGSETPLKDLGGWIQRCPACLDAEIKEKP